MNVDLILNLQLSKKTSKPQNPSSKNYSVACSINKLCQVDINL